MLSSATNWPGEREPARDDVQVANETPEAAFFSQFKSCLLADPEAFGDESLMNLELDLTAPKKYTYPLTLLSEFPRQLPTEGEIAHLIEPFAQCCSSSPFLGRLHIQAGSPEPVAAPLAFAIGCLASVHTRNAAEQSKDLFFASRGLLGALMEIDNRESRFPDLLLAATLDSIYGALSADTAVWAQAGQTLCTSFTIARRMRYHDPKQFERLRGCPAPSHSGPLVWCLWLIDIIQALHFELSINFFTSRELKTSMPSSTLEFQHAYRSLLDDRTDCHQLAGEHLGQEDALLLLMALLSDLLHARRALEQMLPLTVFTGEQSTPYNPFGPFSPRLELDRVEGQISRALDKWHKWFHAGVPPEIMAFYHYCKMYLSFDYLLNLPRLAGYRGVASAPFPSEKVSLADTTVRAAWRILDSAAMWSQQNSADQLWPIWLPIVVFHAGLVVWAQYSLPGARSSAQYGSPRILLAFKIELDKMPWPCCVEMAATLERLIAAPTQEVQ
ncbi:uncharacterized protein PV07_09779 [Cladophialophora immunda]|uniref:Transcription factor domain-containing protein n=1 Tax=Cladophialophora immunda TaxID=569365 RepID=A0A0D2C0P6_9EURO|nr:uncharacterized protein PV07_09779 [Cladophialophora immunda]KIW24040.1 hypothetical protein PV07_09779 [Cladophialophora immunda]OQV01818.1 hypothetical protein CLAIMM_07109 [Cladophialophora immunda]